LSRTGKKIINNKYKLKIMSSIKLNFINQSADTNNSSIVIFQQNVAEDFGEIAIAGRVIENCGRLDNHPFTYPLDFMV
jgi:hypothetical protein